jgi:hypothetical protein
MTALLFALALPAGLQDDREPPLIFTLEVAGKAVPIEPDRAVEIEAAGKTPVTLRVAPHRVFKRGGLQFHYPKAYGFEADLSDAAVSIWTLSGNDHKIMVFRYPGNTAHEALRKAVLDEMVQSYGKMKGTVKADEITLAGKTLKGTRVDATLLENAIRQRLFSMAGAKDSYLFILQDSPAEGKATAEAAAGEKLFAETFQAPK